MNFLNLFFAQILLFFAAVPAICASQAIQPRGEELPEPLISVISTLPGGYINSFSSVTTIGDGMLLASGDNQLLIFDGINWEWIATIGKALPVADRTGRTFFLTNGRIEQLLPNGRGGFARSTAVDSPLIPKNDPVTKLHIAPNGDLLFTTGNMLWKYSDTLCPIDSSMCTLYLLDNEDEIFYVKDGKEFFKYNITSGPELIYNKGEGLTSKKPIRILTINGQLHVVVSDYPWIINLNTGKTLAKFEHCFRSKHTRILKVKEKHGKISILTDTEGIIAITTEMEPISFIRDNATLGLIQAIDILPISESSTLVLTKTSVLRVFYPDAAGYYPTNRDFSSSPAGIAFHNDILYCADGTAVYGANHSNFRPNALSFKKVKGIHGSIEVFYTYKNTLFAAGKAGVFIIHDFESRAIQTLIPAEGLRYFNFIEHNNNLWLVAAQGDGVVAYCISDNAQHPIQMPFLTTPSQVENLWALDGSVMAKSTDGNWYSANLFMGKVDWTKLFTQLGEIPNLCLPSGKGQNVFTYQKGALYRFDFLNSTLTPVFVADSLSTYQPLFEMGETLFVKRFCREFPEFFSIWQYNSSTDNPPKGVFRLAATLPANESISQALLLPDSTLFISSTTGLYYFSQSKMLSKAFGSNVSIFRLSLNSEKNSTYLKNGYVVDNYEAKKTKLYSADRNLRFSLASIDCSEWGLAHGKVQYSSFLDGHDYEWTMWTSTPTRDVYRLSPGEYTLYVKSRTFTGEESDIEAIAFTVLPKYYQTRFFIIGLIVLFLVSILMLFQWTRFLHAKTRFKLESIINKRTEELVKEKEKTENLLARVLPKETAVELKEKGRVSTQRFQLVTVLFCDIEGFTKITDEINPEVLIDQLDQFFLYFDSVVEKYGIEKIKTIGDAYMCAGGIPKKNQTNPIEVVLVALEMMLYMKHITANKRQKSKVWDLRIGIDTGPVIAGVVGRNKLSYDIWGSTVNTASRMESSGEAGHINISENTHMLVKDFFICSFRGKIPIKNKGDIQMYFVNGIKPSLSEKMQGIVPNQDFFIQLQLIRLGDLESFILDKLEKGLPKNLYYHNLKHTIDVYTQVELIGRSENVTKEELLLLRTAALFHDAGHLIDYDTHEEMSVKLVNEILPQYQYSERQINIIAQLIMATKLPPNPTNLLEEIMCDADLDYLGRQDFLPVSNTLYKELHEHGKIGTEREWNEMQIKFINNHFYFTKTARKQRNVNKQSQLDKLRAWMDRN